MTREEWEEYVAKLQEKRRQKFNEAVVAYNIRNIRWMMTGEGKPTPPEKDESPLFEKEPHLGAIADAANRRHVWRSEDSCGHNGPYGYCARKIGHTESNALRGLEFHYSWDTDHFEQWPVGWVSDDDFVKQVLQDRKFEPDPTSSVEYQEGWYECLEAVRKAARKTRY